MFSLHNHSGISSASRGFTDSSIKLEDLVVKAKELGLNGIAITDHEAVGSFVQAKNLEKKYDIPVLCGNEIYLVSDEQDYLLRNEYKTGMYYPHFLLIALDEIGNQQLRELSTLAWMNSYTQRGIRTPTLMSDVEKIIGSNKGHVVASSACFVKGTTVETKDGFKPIEEVEAGEYVFTHMGNWKRVNYPTQRYFNGSMHTIKTQGVSFPFQCTDNHKFFTLSKEDYKNYSRYGVNDLYHSKVLPSTEVVNRQMIRRGLSKFTPQWVEAKDLEVGDYLLTPMKTEVKCVKELDFTHVKDKERSVYASRLQELNSYKIPVEKNLLEILGLFVADGCFQRTKGKLGINFTFHREDIHLIDKVTTFFESMGLNCSVHEKKSSLATDVSISSVVIYEIFKEIFDGVCDVYTKRVPEFIKFLKPQLQMHFLKGYILGDGHIKPPTRANGKKQRNITTATVSKTLALDLVSLLHRNFINPNTYVLKERVDKDGVRHRESYYLEINGKIVNKIVPFLKETVEEYEIDYNFLTTMHVPVIHNGTYYMKQKVQSNTSEKVKTTVHCLNVEGDHSFVANNVAAHNCLGSQLSQWILDIMEFEHDVDRVEMRKRQIVDFVNWCESTFGKGNFFLECQPPSYIEGDQQEKQAYVNQYMLNIGKGMGIPWIITSDSHYLSKELLPIHSAFLNSKDGGDEREVEDFYATAYLMGKEEVVDYFKQYWDMEDIQIAIDNTNKIGNRAKRYSLTKKQVIPKIKLENGWEVDKLFFPVDKPYIQKMLGSKHEQDRYLMYLIEKGMKELIQIEDYDETFTRVEQEVAEFWYVSDIIEDRLGAYFITVAKLVEIMWSEGDSIVAPGRGSVVSSIVSYLLGVTQINPLKMPVDMPFYRFIDRERAEMPDVDLDSQSNRRTQIFHAVRRYFEDLGGEVVNCCTYGTLGAKSAIQTACRGLGIPQEDGQSISSLIPTERGFTWSLDDCYYGNEEKERKPIREFINLVDQNESLWDVARLVEGVIVSRGVHAGGVFITNDKFTNYGAKMMSKDNVPTTQWDLHDSESMGVIKYDMLTTEALTKIRLTLDMLVENNYIEQKKTLKETYYSVLDPHKINYDKPEVWQLIGDNQVADLFQFDSLVAMQTVRQIKPKSLIELAQSNSLMRLQPQEGAAETPTETYTRYKNDISEWYRDMDKASVPKEDQEILKRLLLSFNGVADTQEAIMALARDEELTNFTVGEAHELRSIIGRKKAEKIPYIREKFYSRGLENNVCENTLNYLWKYQVLLQLNYSFSILHTMAYTFIALQQLILYHQYPSIYWNTATLTVNSGSVEDDWASEDEVLEGEESVSSKSKATNYGKVAKAIGDLQHRGVTVALPLINQANYSFTPDEENNRIVFGFKGIHGINDDVANTIINLRPYKSFQDFYEKVTNIDEDDKANVKINNSKIITLIKAGCFDELEEMDRVDVMLNYIKLVNEPRKSLNMQNFRAAVKYNIIPKEYADEVRLINFRDYVLRKENFVRNDKIFKSKKIYKLEGETTTLQSITDDFFQKHYMSVLEEDKNYWYGNDGEIEFYDSDFKRATDKKITKLREWLGTDEAVKSYNKAMYDELWEQHCSGSLSKWEMDSVSFYAHEHELINVNMDEYNIVDFNNLPEQAEVVGSYKWRGRDWDEFAIHRIIGTVLDRDKTKHTVSLLTPTGVVTLKMYSGNFAHYDKQVAQTVIENGKEKKQVIEPSWFTRGNHLSVVGFRRESTFVPKKYRSSVYQHTIQLITDVNTSGEITLQSERKRV